MKNASRFTALIALTLIALAAASATATEGVSPGAPDRLAVVNDACPTFSWQDDEAATIYEIVAYSLHTDESPAAAELAAEAEVLYSQVPAGATSWTPSAEQCFAPGGRYVWFVRAVTELADVQVIEAGEWSAGRYFTVPATPSEEEMRRAVEVLRRWDAANGNGSLMLSSSTAIATSADSGTGSGTGTGSNHRKSVPTASAAIRGEHPDTTGEVYGLVGTSASSDGAGVAAANLVGGPDLVLDGMTNGETDTLLSEAGIDRASVNSEVFEVKNSGPGGMRLSVEGEIAATALDCPNCVDSAGITDGSIIDNDLAEDAVTEEKIEHGAVGTAKLQNNSVTSVKIADGTVSTADLADDSVTGAKIADGAVDATALRNNAVTTNKIADGTITAADISPSAALDADTLDGHDSVFFRNATNLNAGTLGTSRYSAIADLGSEGHLGNAGGDLAQNNGVLQVDLNADLLDGAEGSSYQQKVETWMVSTGSVFVDECASVHSISISVAATGTVMLDAFASVEFYHVSGTADHMAVSLDSIPDSCQSVQSRAHAVLPEAYPTGTVWPRFVVPISLFQTFYSVTPGAHTYYFNAEMETGGAFETDQIANINIRAIFIPD